MSQAERARAAPRTPHARPHAEAPCQHSAHARARLLTRRCAPTPPVPFAATRRTRSTNRGRASTGARPSTPPSSRSARPTFGARSSAFCLTSARVSSRSSSPRRSRTSASCAGRAARTGRRCSPRTARMCRGRAHKYQGCCTAATAATRVRAEHFARHHSLAWSSLRICLSTFSASLLAPATRPIFAQGLACLLSQRAVRSLHRRLCH